jgi:hypothetical protein
MSRELLKTGLRRLATVAFKLKTIVGLGVTFDSGGFPIFCGARVTGFSGVLQHINERKESFVGGGDLSSRLA